MQIIDAQSRAVSLAIGILLLLSPVLAGAQGSRFPGLSAPSAETARNKPVEVTFTKWVTVFPAMEGVTGGDVPGDFVGEVFERQVSQLEADEWYSPPTCGRIIRIEAMYEVQAGKQSFTALIRGGLAAIPARRCWTASSCSGGGPARVCMWNFRRCFLLRPSSLAALAYLAHPKARTVSRAPSALSERWRTETPGA
jgi:hypothetical protein